MRHDYPLVSIVTICFNAEHTIQRTIESVITQTYPNIEYIIIDGGSSDRTLEIIESYSSHVHLLVSEPDNGISDAYNKGLAHCNGEFIQLLSADDYLAQNTIEISFNNLKNHPEAGFVYGDIILVDSQNRKLMRIYGDKKYKKSIKYFMPRINHPTVLVRKSLYEIVGGFIMRYKIALDYDWMLRAHNLGYTGRYCSNNIVYVSIGGNSMKDWRRTHAEEKLVSIDNGTSKIIADLIYYMRITKVNARLILERILPNKFIFIFRRGKVMLRDI